MRQTLLLAFIFLSGYIHCQIDFKAIKNDIGERVSKVNLDSIANSLGYKKGDLVRVSTMFTINESGNIEKIVARGPHQSFEGEAIRILEKLPKMDPAIVNGKSQSVRFALPINFKIKSDEKSRKRKKRKAKRKDK